MNRGYKGIRVARVRERVEMSNTNILQIPISLYEI